MRGYSEQLSSSHNDVQKLALVDQIDDELNLKKSGEDNNQIARRQKLLQLSKAVVLMIREQGLKQNAIMTGTQITNDILKQFNYFRSPDDDGPQESNESIFKNIQRRVYDTINVLDALNVISKNKNVIVYNPHNEFFHNDDVSLKKSLKMVKRSERNDLMKQRINMLKDKLRNKSVKNAQKFEAMEENRCKLQEMIKQHISIRKLVRHNIENSYCQDVSDSEKCFFPLLLLKSNNFTLQGDSHN